MEQVDQLTADAVTQLCQAVRLAGQLAGQAAVVRLPEPFLMVETIEFALLYRIHRCLPKALIAVFVCRSRVSTYAAKPAGSSPRRIQRQTDQLRLLFPSAAGLAAVNSRATRAHCSASCRNCA